MNKREPKCVVCVRLTAEQTARIDEIVRQSRKDTGFDVNRSDVVRKLVDVALARVAK